MLAAAAQGREVTTLEGLVHDPSAAVVQRAFVEAGAVQCGFCTPGFVVATHAALERAPEADLDELKYQLSGNLCRCGTYPHVFEAAQAVQEDRARGGEGR